MKTIQSLQHKCSEFGTNSQDKFKTENLECSFEISKCSSSQCKILKQILISSHSYPRKIFMEMIILWISWVQISKSNSNIMGNRLHRDIFRVRIAAWIPIANRIKWIMKMCQISINTLPNMPTLLMISLAILRNSQSVHSIIMITYIIHKRMSHLCISFSRILMIIVESKTELIEQNKLHVLLFLHIHTLQQYRIHQGNLLRKRENVWLAT